MAMLNSRYKRNISYVNKDFAEFRIALINHAKQYFPNTVNDFNEASPGTMMIEMASYVGDVLAFFADVSLQESLLSNVEERINLYNLSQGMGYKAKTVVPASVDLDIFQLIPSVGSGTNTRPDFRYALYVKENMQVSTSDKDAVPFYTKDAVDFRFSSSYDPTTITVYSVTGDGAIEYYLLKKKVRAVSGQIRTKTFQFSEPKIYDKIVLPENNVTEVIKVTDSDNNVWYEVPYLSQDLVPISVRNVPYNDPKLSKYRSSVPYILSYKQTERRFITRLRKDDRLEIQFGSGLSSEADEEIVPNPMNVGLGLNYFERVADVSIDPMNFLYTRTYGSAPANTVLTVQYATATGVSDNVSSNLITEIISSEIIDPVDTTDPTVLNTIRDSLSINNPYPAFGGQNRKPLESIRQEAMANFAAQNRAVTKEDYILRCLSMPAKYGGIAKAYVEQDFQLGQWNEERTPNPFALNLYILASDSLGNPIPANEAIKENLRQYLRQYRMMTDAINIKDPFLIDLGINVDVIVRPNENSNEVLLKCSEKLIELFKPEKLQINQPILLSSIRNELDKIDGVQSVQRIDFVNKVNMNEGYAGNQYDVKAAIRGDVLYPSLDPCLFRVPYPKRDILIRAVEI
jgi:hypothetical protein